MTPSEPASTGLTLPQRRFIIPSNANQTRSSSVASPGHESFTGSFGNALPAPIFLDSDLGSTALYDLPPPSGTPTRRSVLIVHGLNTPALGMLPLAREIQSLDRDAHIVLFDLWGHGLSSTPLVPHAPHIFHLQIFQVLGHMGWAAAHLLGFSFGGSTAVSFTLTSPRSVLSVGLLAPAGLMAREVFGDRMNELLDDTSEDQAIEAEAADCTLNWLEGGELVVPEDWEARSRAGEVVAAALRQWELDAHQGYRQSVLSMMRIGGVTGCEDVFRKCAKMSGINQIGIVAENDPVCSEKQLLELGFQNVHVVQKADHGFVRTEAREVAQIIFDFWTQ